jgi:hypothetical protein
MTERQMADRFERGPELQHELQPQDSHPDLAAPLGHAALTGAGVQDPGAVPEPEVSPDAQPESPDAYAAIPEPESDTTARALGHTALDAAGVSGPSASEAGAAPQEASEPTGPEPGEAGASW